MSTEWAVFSSATAAAEDFNSAVWTSDFAAQTAPSVQHAFTQTEFEHHDQHEQQTEFELNSAAMQQQQQLEQQQQHEQHMDLEILRLQRHRK